MTSPLDLCKKYYDKKDLNVCAAVLPNSICIVSITSKHIALQSGPIKSLKYLFDRPWRKNIHSEEKFKSIKINAGTQLCEIIAGDGTPYIIKSPVKGEIRELNERILSNLTLLDSSSESSGYLAIVLSKPKHLQQDIERLTEEQVSLVEEDDIENCPPPSNKENIEVLDLDDNDGKENDVNKREGLINQLIEVKILENSAEEHTENNEANDDISTLEKEKTNSCNELIATVITNELITKDSIKAVSEKEKVLEGIVESNTVDKEVKQCLDQNEKELTVVHVSEGKKVIDDYNVETEETIETSKSDESESILEATTESKQKEVVKGKSRRRKTIATTESSGSDETKTLESVRSTRSKRRKTVAIIGAEDDISRRDTPQGDQKDEVNNDISADQTSIKSVDIDIKASSVVESESISAACEPPLKEKSLTGGRRRRTIAYTALSENNENNKSLIKERGTRSKRRKTAAEAAELVVTYKNENEETDKKENEETVFDKTDEPYFSEEKTDEEKISSDELVKPNVVQGEKDVIDNMVESLKPNPIEEKNDEEKISNDVPKVESVEQNVVQSEEKSDVESNNASDEAKEKIDKSIDSNISDGATDVEPDLISEVVDSVVEKKTTKGRRRKTIASTESSESELSKSSRVERSKRNLRRKTVASSEPVQVAITEEEEKGCNASNTNVVDSTVEAKEPNPSEEKNDEEKISNDVPRVESVEPNDIQIEKEKSNEVELNVSKDESAESIKDSVSEATVIEPEPISEVVDSVVEKKTTKGRRRKTIVSTESSGPESPQEERSKRSLRRKTLASSEPVEVAVNEEGNDCNKNNTTVTDSTVESKELNPSKENNDEEKISTDVPQVESIEPNVVQIEKEGKSEVELNVSKDESEESIKASIPEPTVIEPESVSEVVDSVIEKKPAKGRRRKTIASTESSGSQSPQEERSKRSLRRKTVASSEPVGSTVTEEQSNDCNKNNTNVVDSKDESNEPNPSEEKNDEEKISNDVPQIESIEPNDIQIEKEGKSEVELNVSKDKSDESIKDSVSEPTVIEPEPISEVVDSVVEKKTTKGRRRKTIASTESSGPESPQEERSKRSLRRKTVASSEPVEVAVNEVGNDCNKNNTTVTDSTVESKEPDDVPQIESIEPNVVQSEKEGENEDESNVSKDESEESIEDSISGPTVKEPELTSEVVDSVVEEKTTKGRRRKTIASTESSGPESPQEGRSKRSLRRKTVASSEPVESTVTEEESPREDRSKRGQSQRKSRRRTITSNENVEETESIIIEGESKEFNENKKTVFESNTGSVGSDISEKTVDKRSNDFNKDKIAELDSMPKTISSEEKDDEKIIFLDAPTVELNESDNAEEKNKDNSEKSESATESKEPESAVIQKETSTTAESEAPEANESESAVNQKETSTTAESEAPEANESLVVDKAAPRGRRRRTIAAMASTEPRKEIEARPTRSKRRKTLATTESTVENKSGKSLENQKPIDHMISNLENENEQISAAAALDEKRALDIEDDLIEKDNRVKDCEETDVDFSRSDEEIFKQTPLRQKWLKVTNLSEVTETVIVSDEDVDTEEKKPANNNKKLREKRRKTIDTVKLSDGEDFEDISATRTERSKRRKTIAASKLTETKTCVIDSPSDTVIERKTSRGRVIQTIPVINLSDEDTDVSTSPGRGKTKSVANRKSLKKDNKKMEHPGENVEGKKAEKGQQTKPARLRKR